MVMLLGLPYLMDLISGLTAFYFAFQIYDHESEQEEKNAKKQQKKQEAIMANPYYDMDSTNCCICLEDEANFIVYRCGHKVLCEQCSKII